MSIPTTYVNEEGSTGEDAEGERVNLSDGEWPYQRERVLERSRLCFPFTDEENTSSLCLVAERDA